MSRLSLSIVLFLAACGTEPSEPPATSSCGVVGATAGMECTGLSTCGAGAQNFKKVTPCDHCLAGADSHVCEAGVCRMLPTAVNGYGTIKASFSLQQVGSTAQGLAQSAIHPVMADGTKVTCAALMSTCSFINLETINALSSAANVVAGDVVMSFTTIDPGPDRLYFAQFTAETRGRGAVLAKGCVEGLTIAAGETKEISVDLVAP